MVKRAAKQISEQSVERLKVSPRTSLSREENSLQGFSGVTSERQVFSTFWGGHAHICGQVGYILEMRLLMVVLTAGLYGSGGFGGKGHAEGREDGALAEPASLGPRM